jgi:hypothetical protein
MVTVMLFVRERVREIRSARATETVISTELVTLMA